MTTHRWDKLIESLRPNTCRWQLSMIVLYLLSLQLACGLNGTEVGNGRHPEKDGEKPATENKNQNSPDEGPVTPETNSDVPNSTVVLSFVKLYPQLFNSCASPLSAFKNMSDVSATVLDPVTNASVEINRVGDEYLVTEHGAIIYKVEFINDKPFSVIVRDSENQKLNQNESCGNVNILNNLRIDNTEKRYSKYSTSVTINGITYQLSWYVAEQDLKLMRIDLSSDNNTTVFTVK